MAKRARILLIGLLLFLLLLQTMPHELKATVNPTNVGLAEFAHKALRENWGYVYGTYGQVISPSVLNGKISQYPSQFAELKKDGRTVAQHAQKWLGGRAADCVGLAKAYLWWQNDSLGPKYTTATDFSANVLYSRSTVNGPISNMPATHGLMLWRNGHVGIYVGNDEVIEARGVEYGVVKTRLGDRNWTRWFIHPDLAYISQGWVTIDQDQFYYRGGQYVTGEQTIDGRLYLFDNAGRRQSGMQVVGGTTVYYPTSGQKKSGWQTIEGNRYYLDAQSSPLTGWQTLSGQTYYFAQNGIMQTGWQQVDGQIYYLSTTGQMQTGLLATEGGQYRLANDGQLLPGSFGAGGLYYTAEGRLLLDARGQPLTGWQNLTGSRAWFSPATGLAGGPGLVQTENGPTVLGQAGTAAGENKLVWLGDKCYYLADQGQPLAGDLALPAYNAAGEEERVILNFSSTDYSLQLAGQNSLETDLRLEAGQTSQFLLTEPDPESASERVWLSLDPAVASVDETGVVRAGLPGRTLAGFYQADELNLSRITVYSDSAALADQAWPSGLTPGSGAPWPFPGLAEEHRVLYQLASSAEDVVAVLPSGQLVAKKPGQAVLSLLREGQKLAEKTLLVAETPLAISSSCQTVNLNLNEAQPSPFSLLRGQAGQNLQYSSSQPATVQVDKDGQIKGLKPGQAVVTASYQGLQYSVNVSVSGSLPLLKRGSGGEHVVKLQEHLLELGYLAKPVDGIYDSTDEFAVRCLQEKMRRTQTGEADSNLQKLLYDKLAGPASKSLTQNSLAQGDKGEQVLVLQHRLLDLHTFKLDADGSFGDHTVRAVKLFQQLNGLPVTGTISKTEIKLLYQPGVVAAEGTISAGASGPAVTMLQERLQELGYYINALDGYFSSQLTQAVRAFQQKAGLAVDGKAGPLTNKILFSSSAPRQTVQPGPSPTPQPTPSPAPPSPTPTPAPETKPEPPDQAGGASSTVPAPSSLQQTLRRGSRGEDVRRLQLRLTELGYPAGSADGSFGPKTEEAVRAYQRSAGLAADGLAGPLTLTRLFSTASKPVPPADPAPPKPETKPEPPGQPGGSSSAVPAPSTLQQTLRRGSRGEDVRRLQLRLTELGYPAGSADGSFGPKTEEAVRTYQRAAGLTADGLAGPLTLTRLFSTASKPVPPAEPAPPKPETKPEPPGQTGGSSSTVPAPSTLQQTLRRGSQGENVRRLQLRLTELGYAAGSADGSFGPRTEEAVRAYQRSAGLAVDGLAGPQTLTRLFSTASKPVAPADPAPPASTGPEATGANLALVTLRRGHTGENVRLLQQRLAQLGYSPGVVDGSFGAKTEQAVLACQRKAGLAADGICGPQTIAVLNRADAPVA